MEKLMKLMEKKKKEGKSLDPASAKAKMSMLQALSGEMDGMLKEHLMKPEHKVEVAADDKEGLEAGLDKAKEALHGLDSEGDEDSKYDEDSEDEVADAHPLELEEASEDDLSDEDIAHLERLLAKAKAKKA